MPKENHPVILRRAEVLSRTGLSVSILYDLLNPHSKRHDPQFPKQIPIACTRSVGWLESEISEWINAQAAKRGAGHCPMHPSTAKAVGASRAKREAAAQPATPSAPARRARKAA